LTLTNDLDFQSLQAMVMTYSQSKGQSVQKDKEHANGLQKSKVQFHDLQLV